MSTLSFACAACDFRTGSYTEMKRHHDETKHKYVTKREGKKLRMDEEAAKILADHYLKQVAFAIDVFRNIHGPLADKMIAEPASPASTAEYQAILQAILTPAIYVVPEDDGK